MTQITNNLCSFLDEARHVQLDEKTIEKAKHHIVDTIAAMISGTALDVGKRSFKALPSFEGLPEATVFGQKKRYPAYWAAMFNAMLAHADETDDSHETSITHPGCRIVPTAMAMAQREKKRRHGFHSCCVRGLRRRAATHGSAWRHGFEQCGHLFPRHGRCLWLRCVRQCAGQF